MPKIIETTQRNNCNSKINQIEYTYAISFNRISSVCKIHSRNYTTNILQSTFYIWGKKSAWCNDVREFKIKHDVISSL